MQNQPNEQEGVMTCPRCRAPHPALNGMTPWDYYHSCANLGKYEEPGATYQCACDWLDTGAPV